MIPSQRWFPSNLQDRAAWYQNFNAQFAAIGTSLGFTAGDIAAVDKDNQVLQFLADTMVQLDAYKKAVGQYLRIITEGDIGDPTPAFPANPNFTLPITVDTGIFERLVELVERIKAAPAYTNETGALLGIIASAPDSISPEDVKPVTEVHAAQSNYEFAVVVSNRAKSDSWIVEIRREGQEKWEEAKTATGKSVNVQLTPTEDGKPERIQVRVRLRKNNEDYGQLSDIVYVTVNP